MINKSNQLLLALKAELLKFKKSYIVHLTYIFPLSFLGLIFWIMNHSVGTNGIMMNSKDMEVFLKTYFGLFIFILLPVIMSFYSSKITFIEHKNGTNKMLELQPIDKGLIYLSKCILVFCFTLISILFFWFIILLSSLYLKQYYTNLVFDFSAFFKIFKSALLIWYFILPVILIHTWIGYRFNIYLLNIALGVITGITSNIFIYLNASNTRFIPWAFPFQFYISFNATKPVEISFWEVSLISTIFLIILGIAGYYFISRK